MDAFVHVETTFPGTAEAARRFGETFLRRRLAACVNRIPKVQSSYWWKGRIEDAAETLLVFKTVAARADELVDAIRRAHPYEVPYIAVVPLDVRVDAYGAWLTAETTAAERRAPGRPRRPARR